MDVDSPRRAVRGSFRCGTMALRTMRRICQLGAALLVAACAMGCGSEPSAVVVTAELTGRWQSFPHRISAFELSFEPGDVAAEGGAIVAENAGGSFGAADAAFAREGFLAYRSDHLVQVATSVWVEIPPTGGADPEAFVATGTARAGAAPLADAEILAAFLRGYRIDTDRYDSPPAFDPPYLPGDGFTTQGIGIQLGEPARDGGDVSVEVTVRNSLGPSDRGDMNAAIPIASTWVRVDLIVVGVVGADAAVSRGEVSYTLSTAEYGADTVHPRAPEDEQRIEVTGTPGLASAVTGLTGFDLWLNVPGRIDPSCEVVQDPINSWDEPISGPGRYVTELGVRLWDVSYAPDEGRALGRVDLYLSNRSTFKEVGNVCLGTRAEVGVLQVDAPVEATVVEPVEVRLRPGPNRIDVTF